MVRPNCEYTMLASHHSCKIATYSDEKSYQNKIIIYSKNILTKNVKYLLIILYLLFQLQYILVYCLSMVLYLSQV